MMMVIARITRVTCIITSIGIIRVVSNVAISSRRGGGGGGGGGGGLVRLFALLVFLVLLFVLLDC